MSKWDIEETLKEADGEYISREEVCTDCPKNVEGEECEFWKNCKKKTRNISSLFKSFA